MSTQSLSVVLAERPKGPIVPGKTFRQQATPTPKPSDLKEGEILIETLYLSLDPAMRGWLDDVRSYVPPVQIGEVMRGSVIARVLASRSPRASAGDIVIASTGWREVAVAGPKEFETAADVPLPRNGKVTDLQGVLGMTGLTAYFGMSRIGAPGPGETVVVSGAAGATGSVAAQVAKIAGARVVGLAGSDEKCAWLERELGFDVCLNYKDPEFRRKFKEATPKYIDVYFDNGEFWGCFEAGTACARVFALFLYFSFAFSFFFFYFLFFFFFLFSFFLWCLLFCIRRWNIADDMTTCSWRGHPRLGAEPGEQECAVRHVWCHLSVQLDGTSRTTGTYSSPGAGLPQRYSTEGLLLT